jgi:hypothetical protein
LVLFDLAADAATCVEALSSAEHVAPVGQDTLIPGSTSTVVPWALVEGEPEVLTDGEDDPPPPGDAVTE